MSTAQEAANKAVARRLRDVVNTGDLELISRMIDEDFEPDVVIRTPLPLDVTGREAIKRVWVTLLRAYPDLQLTIEDLIAEGDKVVSRNSVTGTNLGDYLGRPPTGKPVTYSEIFIFRLVNGRVAETWGVVDVLAQMRQLGVLPPAAIPEERPQP